MTQSTPSLSDSATPNKPGPSLTQPALLPLFAEAFHLLRRYFIVVYPILLYFILTSFLVPQVQPDTRNWAWWVIIVGLIALLYLFTAGWNAMMAEAVATELTPTVAEPAAPSLFRPFHLAKAFIPGMGEFGLPMLLGGLLWWVINVVIMGGAIWIGLATIGLPRYIWQVLEKNSPVSPDDIQHWLIHASRIEQNQVAAWDGIFLGMLILLFVLNLLMQFWPYLIIIHRRYNPLWAFWASIKLALRYPFKTVFLLLFQGLFYTIFVALSNASNIGAMLSGFFLILGMAYFGFFMFLYLMRLNGSPDKAS